MLSLPSLSTKAALPSFPAPPEGTERLQVTLAETVPLLWRSSHPSPKILTSSSTEKDFLYKKGPTSSPYGCSSGGRHPVVRIHPLFRTTLLPRLLTRPTTRLATSRSPLHGLSIDKAIKLELKISCVEPHESHSPSPCALSTVRVFRHITPSEDLDRAPDSRILSVDTPFSPLSRSLISLTSSGPERWWVQTPPIVFQVSTSSIQTETQGEIKTQVRSAKCRAPRSLFPCFT